MKTQKLLVIAAIVCLLVGTSGPAQAEPGDAAAIIADFCETIADDAVETVQKLGDAEEDLGKCAEDFSDCRDGGLIGDGDPLVECLSDGLSCSGRANGDKVEACFAYKDEFADAYERALRSARFKDVEDRVQNFFNSQS